MLKAICLVLVLFLLSCKTTTYYISRHGEKQPASMNSDPPLTAEGERQVMDLQRFLQGKKIKYIYSTNYVRTLKTAEPTRQFFGVTIKLYDPKKMPELIDELKKIKDGNVLIVGHSNTVDDVVNGLTGKHQMDDLADNEYGDVFIVKKKANSYTFERMKVPRATMR